MNFYRSDQAAPHCTVAGVQIDNLLWDSMEGGDATAETVQYPPGGMAPTVDLGGIAKRSDLVITREWSDTLIGIYKQLDAGTGKARVTASYSNLDANGVIVPGSTITYTGTLKGVMRPNYQAGTAELAKLQLTIGMDVPIS